MAISNWRFPLSFSFLRCLGLACSGLESLRNTRADNRRCGSLNVIRQSLGARWLGLAGLHLAYRPLGASATTVR